MKGVGPSRSGFLGKRDQERDQGKPPAKRWKNTEPEHTSSDSSSSDASHSSLASRLSERSVSVSSDSSTSLQSSVSSASESEFMDDSSLSDEEAVESGSNREVYPAIRLGSTQDISAQIENVRLGHQRAGISKGNLNSINREKLARYATISKVDVRAPDKRKMTIFYRADCPVAEKAVSVYKQRLKSICELSKRGNISEEVRSSRIKYLLLDAEKELVNGDESYDAKLKANWEDFAANYLSLATGRNVGSSGSQSRRELLDRVSNRVHARFMNHTDHSQLVGQMSTSFGVGSQNKVKKRKQKNIDVKGSLDSIFQSKSIPESKDIEKQIKKLRRLQDAVVSDNPEEVGAIVEILNELERLIYIASRKSLKLPDYGGGLLSQLSSWVSGKIGGASHNKLDIDGLSAPIEFDFLDYGNEEKARVLERIREWVRAERDLVLQVAVDPKAVLCDGNLAKNSLTWNEAIEFKRLGYKLDPRFTCFKSMGHSLDSSDATVEGRYHTVVKMCFKDEEGEHHRMFKPVRSEDISPWEDIVGEERYFDTSSPHFSARNMAVQFIANRLDMVDAIPSCGFFMHKRQLGLLMYEVPGCSGVEAFKKDGELATKFRNFRRNKKQCSELLQKLNRLEWIDALCAEPDRHPGNLIFNEDSVAGVDNDFCLYPFDGIIAKDSSKRESKELTAGCKVGYPLVIDRDTYTFLKELDLKELQYELRHHIDRDEVDSLVERHKKLLAHAEALENQGLVIDDWETWRDVNGNNIYEHLTQTEVNRERLKKHHSDRAGEVKKRKGYKRLSKQEKLDYDFHNNLAKTMELGVRTSYLTNLLRLSQA